METKLSSQLAKHFRELHFGGNWTCSDMKTHLTDVTWQEAVQQVYSLNSIATLTYHLNYYVCTAIRVFLGEPLNSKDELSFAHPPIHSQRDWNELLEKTWKDAEECASLIEKLENEKLWENFTDKKYGIYYRNIHGIIEHAHYHLGQIVLIKKIIRRQISKEPN